MVLLQQFVIRQHFINTMLSMYLWPDGHSTFYRFGTMNIKDEQAEFS